MIPYIGNYLPYMVTLVSRSIYGANHLVTATFARLVMALAQMPGSLIPLVEMNVLAVGRDSQEGLSKFSKLAELFSAGVI